MIRTIKSTSQIYRNATASKKQQETIQFGNWRDTWREERATHRAIRLLCRFLDGHLGESEWLVLLGPMASEYAGKKLSLW